MVCSKCGATLKKHDKFCGVCGTAVENTKNSQVKATIKNSVQDATCDASDRNSSSEQAFDYMEPSAYSKVFVEPDEQLLGSLGNGYLENILNKKVKKCHALLTDKRVYLQGTFFTGSGKTLISDTCDKILDLEDITGTGFKYTKPLGKLATILLSFFWGIAGGAFGYWWNYEIYEIFIGILLGEIVPAIIILIQYIRCRKTDFIIEYAGGAIRFDASIIVLSHVKDFHKQMRRAKDHVKGKN